MKKTKKKGSKFNPICLLLLLPALFLGVYGVLMELAVIPKEINVGVVTVEFFDLGENAFMVLLANICFVWFPVLFVFVALISLAIGVFVKGGGAEDETEHSGEPAEAHRADRKSDRVFSDDGLMETEVAEDEASESEEPKADFAGIKRLELESKGRVVGKVVKEYPPVLLKDVADNLRQYAASKGVEMPEKTARAILSAVVSSRVLVTDDRQKDRNKAVIGSIAHYFGGTVHAHSVGLGCYAAEQLTTTLDADSRVIETGFFLDIYGACIDGDKVRFAYLENIDPVAVSNFFGEYREALEGGASEYYVPVDKLRRGNEFKFMENGKVLFPENLILTLAPGFGADITKMSGEAIFLDLSEVVPCRPAVYGGPVGENAYPQIIKALDRARENFYISEEVWKKIDALEEYLNGLIGYRFNNRKIRLMERYSSAYMAMGGSEAEATDSMLSACVFSELYPKRGRFTVRSEEEDLVEFLEREFGTETVPVSIELVRKFYGASAKAAEKERLEAEARAEALAEEARIREAAISESAAKAEKVTESETETVEVTEPSVDEALPESGAEAVSEADNETETVAEEDTAASTEEE